jgi:hypothetical protein
MSWSAARAFMAGRGVALGVGVALACALGKAAEGLVLGTGFVGPSTGEEVVGGESGADGVHATVRTRRDSAAIARRIPRLYVGRQHTLSRASEGPSGSQDVPPAGIDSPCRAVLLPRAHQRIHPRTSACRLSPAHHRRAPSPATRQRGFFVGARTYGVQA